MTGHDPLPKYLANAKVRFRSCKPGDMFIQAPEKAVSISTNSNSGVVSASTSLLGPLPFEAANEQRPASAGLISDNQAVSSRASIPQRSNHEDAQAESVSQRSVRTRSAVSLRGGHYSELANDDGVAHDMVNPVSHRGAWQDANLSP